MYAIDHGVSELTLYYISHQTHPANALAHYIVTLIHRFSNERQVVDLRTEDRNIDAVYQLIREHFSIDWGVFGCLLLDDGFEF